MSKSFWGLIWKSFTEINGFALSSLGVLLAVVTWQSSAEATVSLPKVVIFGSICLILILVFANAAYIAFLSSDQNSPSVMQVKQVITQSFEQSDYIILLLNPSSAFSVECYSSIYHADMHGYENLIAFGIVRNIQQGGVIVVKVLKVFDRELINKMLEPESKPLWQKIRVRLSISRSFMREHGIEDLII
jgi:hypothetical protein